MLNKFFLRAAVTAVALTCTAGSVSAEQYRIVLTDFAFFPEISYLLPGDEVTFENTSGAVRDIAAADGSWSVEALADGAEAMLVITEGMPNEFETFVPGGAEDPVDENGNLRVVGVMNFSGAPEPVEPQN